MEKEEVKLEKGDFFCSKNPMALGKIINAVQWFWSTDNESRYTHAGIIVAEDGTTLESLWTVKNQNLWEAYAGERVIIGRYEKMTPEIFEKGMQAIAEHKGKIYPVLRLLLFGIPPVAKFLYIGLVVCSELTAKFLCSMGALNYWKGKMPDNIHDAMKYRRGFKVVAELEIPKKEV